MASRARPPVTVALIAEQRGELRHRVGAISGPQCDAVRARIILACETGGSALAIAQRLGVHPRTVERGRLVRHGLAGLQDVARSGPKPKFGPVTRLELIALACERVPAAGQRTRTIDGLVDEATARGLIERISWSSYQRILSDIDLRPHEIEGWVHSPDPQFREKVSAITALYLQPPPGAVVVSIDKKTGMQALELRFMDTVAAQYPTGPLHVIWDCLNIHFNGTEQRWTAFNARHGQRFVFHYTPKHASWVNHVELFFSILQRQCLRDASFRSIEGAPPWRCATVRDPLPSLPTRPTPCAACSKPSAIMRISPCGRSAAT